MTTYAEKLLPHDLEAEEAVLEVWPESGGSRVSGYTWGQQV